MYTWGDPTFGALGYIPAHSVKKVDVPRRVSVPDSVAIIAEKTSTTVLTVTGEVFRWGNQVGLHPVKVNTSILIDKIVGSVFLIERGSGRVHGIDKTGSVDPVFVHGKYIYAADAAMTPTGGLMYIEKDSGRLVELGKEKSLSPAGHVQLGCVGRIFSSPSGVYAAQHSVTSEVRVWTRSLDPLRVLVKSASVSTKEWESATSEFFLKNFDSISLPVSGDVGYAVVDGLLVRFDIGASHAVVPGHVVMLYYLGEQVRFKAVAQTATAVHGVSVQGDCFLVPACGDLLDTPVLSQVVSIAASSHHVVGTVKILPLPSLGVSMMSLQRICAKSVMESFVTVENVVDLVSVLSDRAVVDVPVLLNLAYKFFRLNRGLVLALCAAKVRALDAIFGYSDATAEYDRGICEFSDCLIRTRLFKDSGSSQATPVCVKASSPKPRRRVKAPLVVSSQPSSNVPTPTMTPVICMRIEPEANFESPFSLDDFIPLSEAAVARNPASPPIRTIRVSKWTKTRIDRSPPQAPWMSPANTVTKSQKLAQVMDLEPRSRNNLGGSSRWYIDQPSAACSVAELMTREREEREAIEAVRLVEEYERALALHEAAQATNKKYNRDIRRGKPKQ